MPKKSKSPSRTQYNAPTPSSIERPAEVASTKQARSVARPDPWSGETRGAVFITVGWMLSMIVTVVTLLMWLGLWVADSRGVEIPYASYIMFYAMLAALATGFLTLALGLFAQRVRRKQAPPSIRRFAGIVGVLPWAIYATMFLMSR